MKKIPLVIVTGPTASGKTALSIELANSIGGEIVCADSMQIYKYMDIGTAKPTKEERAQCVHHLTDFVEPDCDFSVADYTQLAHGVIADIIKRGKIPVMCGGTGLYISSVADDVEFGDMQNDYKVRSELNDLYKKSGAEAVFKILEEIDPEAAKTLHPNNIKRVIRAIEFYRLSGLRISEHQKNTKLKESRYEPFMFMISRERDTLYERINRRVDIMIDDGLLDEVKSLKERGYTRELNSMQGIGYKELFAYLDGETDFPSAVEAIKQNSRRYAKRQLTWWRRDDRMNFLEPDTALENAIETIKRVSIL